jgi:hypothetical protein
MKVLDGKPVVHKKVDVSRKHTGIKFVARKAPPNKKGTSTAQKRTSGPEREIDPSGDVGAD